MTYGNKIIIFLVILSLFLFTGCSERPWSYSLYDDYKIQNTANRVILTKNDKEVNINDLSYSIKSFKYNSDVVCLYLNNSNYYMIYYVDSSIIGPFKTKSDLEETTNSLSMSFSNDFLDIKKVEDKVYE